MSKPSELIDCPPASHWVNASLPHFSHHFATVEGVRLHFLRSAASNSPSLPPNSPPPPALPVCVLLAGFPQTSYAWHPVLPHLHRFFHLIAIDLPGQGDSDRPNSGYDTQSLAEKVHGVLQQLHLSQYFLVGHDVGAWVAFTFTAMYSQEVKGLALLDAGIPGVTAPTAVPTDPAVAWKVHYPLYPAQPTRLNVASLGH